MIEIVSSSLKRLEHEVRENEEIIEQLRDEIYTNNYFKTNNKRGGNCNEKK
ncbi:hypothetical protein [Wukongibacter sp. M2B1]|uniref:hypothetical protein n=1 Tax=Wukongibacter sp. M2B1 TaxID=3088895 RepID=UPI003D7A22F1